jgi:sodium/potassium-transporting ATPase subunit alpha
VYYRNGLSLHDIAFTEDTFADNEEVFCRNGRCYSPDEQEKIAQQARAAWYLTLIVTQLFHLLNIKATHVSIFKHDWSNPVTYYALALSLSLAIIFVYIPGVNDIMGSQPVGVTGWIPPLAAGAVILITSELRAYYLKSYAKKAAKDDSLRAPWLVRILEW